MAKKSKSFFVPARTEGWYRAISDAQAEKIVVAGQTADKPLYHVSGPVRGSLGHPISGHDNYGLIHMVARSSQAARHELAEILVNQLVQKPDLRDQVLSEATGMVDDAAEQLWDSLELRADTERPLIVSDKTDDPAGTLTNVTGAERDMTMALERATVARDRAFDEGQQFHFSSQQHLRQEIGVIDEGKPLLEALRQFVADGREKGPEAAAAGLKQAMATKVSPNLLVRTMDLVPVHYGGPDNAYDGPTRAETNLRVSATDLAMRHWDEVTAHKPTNAGITVDGGRFRAIPASVVEAQGVRITGQADLAAVRTKPKAQPAAPAPAPASAPGRKP